MTLAQIAILAYVVVPVLVAVVAVAQGLERRNRTARACPYGAECIGCHPTSSTSAIPAEVHIRVTQMPSGSEYITAMTSRTVR
jgi:hypothetical protein